MKGRIITGLAALVLGVRAFDHVVLEIGFEAVLRSENRGELAVGRCAEPMTRC